MLFISASARPMAYELEKKAKFDAVFLIDFSSFFSSLLHACSSPYFLFARLLKLQLLSLY